MTGAEIREDALFYSAVGGYNVQDPVIVQYINRAIDVIVRDYDEVGKISNEAYNIDNTNVNTWINLPSDFLVEKRLYISSNSTSGISILDPSVYMLQNEQIKFLMGGNFEMEYVPVPEYLDNINRIPSINVMWHPAISYYVAYRIKGEIFGDEEGEKHKLYADFEKYCNKVASRLNSRKRPRRVKAPFWG